MSVLKGKLVARNVIVNLIGQGAPLLVALYAIPLLIKQLGTDRFGVLTLAWMFIGYFSLFDFGLGRALTKLIAERMPSDKRIEIIPIASTGLILMAVLGIAGAIILAVLSPYLVHSVLKIPRPLLSESLTSFYILSASIPVVISTSGLRGVLEAYQRFNITNAIRIPMGILTFLGPVIVLSYSQSLVNVIWVLALGRVVAWGLHLIYCLKTIPNLHSEFHFDRTQVRLLLSFGGWMTITNIVGPLMVYMDRFLIGALISVTAVAYYATPYEIVTKLWLIPSALTGVLFPAFSSTYVADKSQTAAWFYRGIKYIFISIFPAVILIICFAHEGLSFWINADFADKGSTIMQLLAAGVFVNSLAQVPFALIAGIGRPDITSKFHLAELPIYLLLVFVFIQTNGVIGLAIAWLIRVTIDNLLLFYATKKLLPEFKDIRIYYLSLTVSLFVFLLVSFKLSVTVKLLYVVTIYLVFVYIVWNKMLSQDERSYLPKLFNLRKAVSSGS